MTLLWLILHHSTPTEPLHTEPCICLLPPSTPITLTCTFPSCDAYASRAPDVQPFHAFTHARPAPFFARPAPFSVSASSSMPSATQA